MTLDCGQSDMPDWWNDREAAAMILNEVTDDIAEEFWRYLSGEVLGFIPERQLNPAECLRVLRAMPGMICRAFLKTRKQ
jgi:hypothetical protein